MNVTHSRWARAWLAAGAVLFGLVLAACDQQNAQKLIEDVSTEADVKRLFGEPKKVTIAADGTRTLDYPKQPEGFANYVMVIGPDGKLKSLRQLLNPDNFAKVKPGMTREEVSNLLGPHARERRFDLKKEVLVEWRYRDQQDAKFFGVTFDTEDKVLSTASVLDPSTNSDSGR